MTALSGGTNSSHSIGGHDISVPDHVPFGKHVRTIKKILQLHKISFITYLGILVENILPDRCSYMIHQ